MSLASWTDLLEAVSERYEKGRDLPGTGMAPPFLHHLPCKCACLNSRACCDVVGLQAGAGQRRTLRAYCFS